MSKEQENEGLAACIRRWWGNLVIAAKGRYWPHSQSTVSKEQENEGLTAYIRRWWGNLVIAAKGRYWPHSQSTVNKEQENEGLTAYIRRWWGNLVIAAKARYVLATFISLIAIHQYDPGLAKFITYLLGGVLIILQISNSNRRATASEETAKAMQKTAELTEKGNIAERFKNAIEHLGNNSASIRLGGVYALHHIAQETEEYRERVFEILCAHIRETTTQKGYKGWETVVPIEVARGQTEKHTEKKPSIEIQSILDLLFIRNQSSEIYKGIKANLSGADLHGASLSNAHLENASLQEAHLEHAFLRGAHLENASLQKAHLEHAFLPYAHLENAFLVEAHLENAILVEAHLENAFLAGAHLENAFLAEAHLENASLIGANLETTRALDIEQILEAKTLYGAKLPAGMEEEIRRRTPDLFKGSDDVPAS